MKLIFIGNDARGRSQCGSRNDWNFLAMLFTYWAMFRYFFDVPSKVKRVRLVRIPRRHLDRFELSQNVRIMIGIVPPLRNSPVTVDPAVLQNRIGIEYFDLNQTGLRERYSKTVAFRMNQVRVIGEYFINFRLKRFERFLATGPFL